MNAHAAPLSAYEQDMHCGPQRELPANIEAEQALLGAMIINNDALEAVRSKVVLTGAHFYEPIHREIYEAITSMVDAGRHATMITIRDRVTDGRIGDMTVSQYLARLASSAVSIVNAPDYARAILEASAQRAIISLSYRMEDVGFSKELDIIDSFDSLRAVFDDVSNALRGHDNEGVSFADAVDGALDQTQAAYKSAAPTGFDCGFTPLSSMIGPLGPGQLIIIGGATKQGKTALTGQIVAGVARSGKPVWFYSGEMSAKELAMRQISTVADVPVWRQKRGKVNDHDYERMMLTSNPMKSWNVRVQEKRMTLEQLRRAAITFVKRHGPSLIVVDHIGLIERDKETRRLAEWEFGQEVTRALKMLARDLESPVLACAQLKKNTLTAESGRLNDAAFFQAISRKPRYSDLIGACERDADHVIIPFRAEPILQELEPPETSDLHIKWEGVMENQRNKGEIILALSRENQWPQRRDVGWNGPKTVFVDQSATDQGRFI